VIVNAVPSVTANVSQSVICAGTATVLTASGASSYVWSNGSSSSTISVSPGTTTTYSCTGTNAAGCSSTASVTVFVNPLPSVSISGSLQINVGGSATLNASGASSYVWSTGDVGASITVSPSLTSTYSVTGTDANGCSNTAQVTVVVIPLPTVSVTASSPTICAGQSTTLTASGCDTYLWSTGQTTASIVVSPSASTTYSCTGTTSGVSSTADATIVVNAAPNVSVSANPSVLAALGLSSTLTASGAATYQWNTGATGSVLVVIPIATTTYSVVGTDINGCTGSASATITLNLSGGLGLRTSSTTPDNDVSTLSESSEPITHYPNPTDGVFYLKNAPKNSTIEVYSIIGERVFSGAAKTEDQEIDVSARPTGIYILKVQSQGQVVYWSKVLRK
jgi:hypothetical protein